MNTTVLVLTAFAVVAIIGFGVFNQSRQKAQAQGMREGLWPVQYFYPNVRRDANAASGYMDDTPTPRDGLAVMTDQDAPTPRDGVRVQDVDPADATRITPATRPPMMDPADATRITAAHGTPIIETDTNKVAFDELRARYEAEHGTKPEEVPPTNPNITVKRDDTGSGS